MNTTNSSKAHSNDKLLNDKLEKGVEQLSQRVRLFIEHKQGRQAAGQFTEREIAFLEFLRKKGTMSFFGLDNFFKKISSSTVSNILKKLHQKKLVSRRENPDDLRSNLFSLTAKGMRFLEPIDQESKELSAIIAESLQLTPEEKATVIKVVERAISNFDLWLGFDDKP